MRPHAPRGGEEAPDVAPADGAVTVPAIGELAAELKAAGVHGVDGGDRDYWRIWFVVLEEAGLAVQLVNSSQARNLPGRPKTDPLTELSGVPAGHRLGRSFP